MLNMLHVLGTKTAYPHVYNMPGEPAKRDRPYFIYFIGASMPSKCWPAENFTQLLRSMSRDYPEHDHLVLEGIQQWETADKILDPIREEKNITAVNTDNIDDTVSLIKGSELVVSNDTGIRHLAIVSDIPTVGIFLSGPYRYWPRYNIHDAAMPDESGIASVENVKSACLNVINKKIIRTSS